MLILKRVIFQISLTLLPTNYTDSCTIKLTPSLLHYKIVMEGNCEALYTSRRRHVRLSLIDRLKLARRLHAPWNIFREHSYFSQIVRC